MLPIKNFLVIGLTGMFFSFSIYAFEEEDGTTGATRNINEPAAPVAALEQNSPSSNGVAIDESTTMFVKEEPAVVNSTAVASHEKRSNLGIGVQGEVGSSAGPFYARLTLSKKINRYFLWDGGGFYSNHVDTRRTRVFYGFETGPRLVLVNPTIFHPFIGGGAGYEVWRQEEAGREKRDDASSITVSYFGGLIANLTKNFGLTLTQRFKNYINSRPYDLTERKRQKNPASYVDVGFVVML